MNREEAFKGWVHAIAALICAIMFAYNLMKYITTKERRNLINAAVYGPACVYELFQASEHWGPETS